MAKTKRVVFLLIIIFLVLDDNCFLEAFTLYDLVMLLETAVRPVFFVNGTVLSLGDRRLIVVVRKFFEFFDHFFKNLNRRMLNMIMITDGNQNENTICVIVWISSMSRSKVDIHIIIFLFSTTTIDRVLGRPKQIATHHILAINISMSLNFDLSLSIFVFLSKQKYLSITRPATV
jgi:hypothetical protein